jgi:CheY-like chemotaxis protein
MKNQSKTIFLAEDDDDDCMIFLEALRALDYQNQIVVSRDGDELMQNLSTRTPPLPDVLFLDINMPGKDGFDCLRDIKNIEELNSMPIVVLSTSNEIRDITLAYRLGAHYYMPKPHLFSKFIERLGKVLQQDLSSRPSKQEFILKS